jgi:hypothetical protein
MRTDNGGETWSRMTLEVNSVCFVTERFGWAAGPHEAGVALFRTADGGLNWTEIPIPLPGGDYRGWAATVRCAGEAAWVLATGDGGAGHISYAVFRMTADGSEPEPRLQDAYTHPLGEDKGIQEAQGPYPGPLTAPEPQSARFITWCPQCFGDLPPSCHSNGRRTVVRHGRRTRKSSIRTSRRSLWGSPSWIRTAVGSCFAILVPRPPRCSERRMVARTGSGCER